LIFDIDLLAPIVDRAAELLHVKEREPYPRRAANQCRPRAFDDVFDSRWRPAFK
jgi:hypothetical protein